MGGTVTACIWLAITYLIIGTPELVGALVFGSLVAIANFVVGCVRLWRES